MTINIVQKYNGRSLYSMKKLREVAAHIASLRGQYENMVIVVGNMGPVSYTHLTLPTN